MKNDLCLILYLMLVVASFFSSCRMTKTDSPEPMPDDQLTYLALGDSYTIGESVMINDRFPVQLVDGIRREDIAMADPRIIAMTGWTTLDLEDAIEQANVEGQTFDLVSLLIGVNDQFQGRDFEEYRPNFKRLLETAIEFAGGDKTRVFVVSIPDYAFTEFGQSASPQVISRQLADYNAVNRSVSLELEVDYVDITPISQRGLDEPELVAEDGLHPSGTMYALWVELILEEKLKDIR